MRIGRLDQFGVRRVAGKADRAHADLRIGLVRISVVNSNEPRHQPPIAMKLGGPEGPPQEQQGGWGGVGRGG